MKVKMFMNIKTNKYKKPVNCGMICAGPGWRAACLLAAALLLPGCAAIALSAVGPAAEYGIDQAFSGVTTKTFTAPMANMRLAALKSLSRMEMDVTEDEGSDSEWAIKAAAGDRAIDIDLASLTAATTRIRVAADNGGIFFKDGATADEIVAQINEALQHDTLYAEQAALNDGGGAR